MELQRIVQRMSSGTISAYRNRRSWLLGVAAIAGTGYGFYRMYKSPSINRKKYQLFASVNSVIKVSEAASVSAETVSFLLDELKNFLSTESDEVPTSLKQLYKITQCREFHQTLTGISSAVAAGIFEGLNARDENFPARAMEKLFSVSGTGFVSVVVGSFVRNLVLSFLESFETLETNSRPSGGGSEFIDLMLSNNNFRAFVVECIQSFVGIAVAIYLDKTMDINIYDQICSALLNPKHEAQMKALLMSIFSGAVETFIKISHDVLTNGSSGMKQNTNPKDGEIETLITNGSSGRKQNSNIKVDEVETLITSDCAEEVCVSSNSTDQTIIDMMDLNSGISNSDHPDHYSWIEKISYTLSMPSNRRLLLEVTGKMTFESVRCFCEFLLFKFSEFFTRTLPVAYHDLLIRLLQSLRHVAIKCMAAASVSLAICWHAFTGMRVFDVLY